MVCSGPKALPTSPQAHARASTRPGRTAREGGQGPLSIPPKGLPLLGEWRYIYPSIYPQTSNVGYLWVCAIGSLKPIFSSSHAPTFGSLFLIQPELVFGVSIYYEYVLMETKPTLPSSGTDGGRSPPEKCPEVSLKNMFQQSPTWIEITLNHMTTRQKDFWVYERGITASELVAFFSLEPLVVNSCRTYLARWWTWCLEPLGFWCRPRQQLSHSFILSQN